MIRDFIKQELKNWGKYEKIFFPIIILIITLISLYLKDNIVALISAVCGISYTILAGKGKISCYFIGMIGTFCYSYLAFKNGFYGNLLLYIGYYFPMEIIGVYKWSKHLKKETNEVIKTKLTNVERVKYIVITVVISLITILLLIYTGGKNPYLDGITLIASILGQFLTVKRCVEQWYIWFFVNLLSMIMWIIAYIEGSNCFATILMWVTYLILSVYFLQIWNKDIKNTQAD